MIVCEAVAGPAYKTDSQCLYPECSRLRVSAMYCTSHWRQARNGIPLSPIRHWKTPEELRACAVEGCDRPRKARGLCETHGDRLKRGDITHPGRAARATICSIDGCNNKPQSRNLCGRHYRRKLRELPLRPLCNIRMCDDAVVARGLCHRHYLQRWTKSPEEFGRQRTYGPSATCEADGCSRRPMGRGYCQLHYARLLRGQNIDGPVKVPARHTTPQGYVLIGVPQDTPGARRVGKSTWIMLEHRYVMQQALGRPLLDHETPHHLNGNRSDNYLSNLELWSSKQIKGQRVSDKLAFAIEILLLYPSFIGLDLVDQANLKVVLAKTSLISRNSSSAKREATKVRRA